MNKLLAGVLCAVLVTPAANGRDRDDEEDCRKVKEQIRRIESRMRAGYTNAQGRRLEERLRKLRKRRSKVCR